MPLFAPDDVPTGHSHPSRAGYVMAEQYLGIVRDLTLLRRAKCLLVDFDNTLWKGVAAEGEVEQDVQLQTILKELKDAGVLLVALSKNDPENVPWTQMRLEREDFALEQINWNAKPANVAQVIDELNLAADAFVLLDDNPVERALVEENVPGVRSLDPGDPATIRTLRRWLEFPSTALTAESQRRTQMYREASQRRSAMGQVPDYDAMMRSLQLTAKVRPATASDKDRLAELIQRTNQFNTTTRRRTDREIQDLIDSDRAGVHVAELRDRFGDLGVVAAAVMDRERAEIDSFVMSCRAMGFGLETYFLDRVLAQEEVRPAWGLFVPSSRNSPAADLYARAGFSEVAPGRWELKAGERVGGVPGWFAMSR